MLLLAALASSCGAPAASPAPPAPAAQPPTPAAQAAPTPAQAASPPAHTALPPEALALSPEEARLVAAVDASADDAVAFLERVVNINSGSMNLAGVREVGRVFADAFEAIGFETEWVEQSQVARAGHLFARRRGQSGARLLLIGHLDTVFEPDSPFQRYQDLGDGRARGPGVIDMKGGNVVMLYALAALASIDALADVTITVALMGDEELTGEPLSESRRSLIEAAQASDVALGFEGAGSANSVTLGRRGFTDWRLEVEARTGHSSVIFSDGMGAGAIYEAARVLTRFYETLAEEPNLTLSAGLIVGGTTIEHDRARDRGSAFGKSNVIPERALVTGDLRTLTLDQRERAKAAMRAIAADSLPHATARLQFRDSYPPMTPTAANEALRVKLEAVGHALQLEPMEAVDPSRRGAADISFAAPHVAAALAGLGAVGHGAHTARETIALDALRVATKRAAVFVYRLTRNR
ncbi:MAG: M20 family metallopeptidase [Haliangiales bacterium]